MRLNTLLIGAVLLVTPAAADMGQIHIDTKGVAVSESAQKAIILVNGSEEVLILGTEMQASKAAPIVRFIPFPAEPKAEIAPKGVFARMAGLIAKYKLEYVTTWHSKGGPAREETSGVQVRFAARMGGHDLTVIKVRDPLTIRAWVNRYFEKRGLTARGGYAAAEKIVSDYVARGFDWFVVDAVELSPDTSAIQPVAYRFATHELYYPLKTSDTFGGQGEIELFVIGPKTLCAPGADGYLDEGDRAIDERARDIGPCFGLKLKASTSAMLVPQEHDVAAIWPESFFAGQPTFLQAFRYAGPYAFDNDIRATLQMGVAKALEAPEPDDNPFIPILAPEEHSQCKLAPDKGPCKGLFESWYFDQNSKTCKSFFWGGCAGSVPFKTQQECASLCAPGK